MLVKYGAEIQEEAVLQNLKKLTNQIYKLLPNREEGIDWVKPLEGIIIEIAGMDRLFLDHHTVLFALLCKLEGLFTLTEEDKFLLYRSQIFECLGLVNELSKLCHQTI